MLGSKLPLFPLMDKLISPIVGVYRAPLKGFLIKGWRFPIPNTRPNRLNNIDPGSTKAKDAGVVCSTNSWSGFQRSNRRGNKPTETWWFVCFCFNECILVIELMLMLWKYTYSLIYNLYLVYLIQYIYIYYIILYIYYIIYIYVYIYMLYCI